LTAVFDQEQWDRATVETLQRTAFIGSDTADHFRAQISQLERLADSGGDGRAAALKLGVCHQLLGQHRAAAEWLARARASALREFHLARSLRELGRYEEALAAFERARAEGWDELECACEKAETHLLMGADAEAADLIGRHERAGADSPLWHYVRGRLLEARGDTAGAMESYEKATDLDADNGRYLFQLAYLHDLYGEDDQALELYQQAASLPVVFANALLNLSVLHEDLGQYDEAGACLHRVLAIDPNHPRARLFLRDVEASKTMIIDEEQERELARRSAVLDIPITEFELSVRARNCLKKMNIATLGDLLKIAEPELLAYKNFGETSLSEIKAMLTSKGLRLGQLADQVRPAPPRAARSAGVEGNPEVLSRAVAELELSVRSRKCLQRLNIATIGDLCSRTEQELLATRNFGQTSLNEIKRRLGELNLRLRRTGE
jgi:DNA-directed RNA polymerase subunit alpha